MDHDAALLTYLRLAIVSQERHQMPGRDRFLLLAIDEALKAGLLDVADRSREVLLASQPHHLLARYHSAADAFAQEETGLLLKQVRRLCPLEKAEALLGIRQVPTAPASVDELKRLCHALAGKLA